MDYHELTQKAQPLIDALLSLHTAEDMMAFVRDVMTEKEIIELTHRIDVAQRLLCHESYLSIQESIGVSSTTVARVAKYLDGGFGGYRKVLGKKK